MQREKHPYLVSARLPDLRLVIVTDSRQPGMLHVDDVFQAGESRHHEELTDLQSKLSFDEPVNIQFTSVSLSRSAPVTPAATTALKRGTIRELQCDMFTSSRRPCLLACFRGQLGIQREPLFPTTIL